MSFRELRNFTEYMRALGYPRLVSMDNFRTPNFGLVADILYWMVYRYDPSAEVTTDVSTEDLRVEFLSSVAQIMWTRSNVKLNMKRLYAADGRAVKELLKIADVLYRAHKANEEEDDLGPGIMHRSIDAKLNDVKATRALASQITESGARLFDLLEEERELAAERQKALRFLDALSNNLNSDAEHRYVEQKAEELVKSARENARAMEKQCEDLESDKKTLQAKIKKKQSELERNDKRWRNLQTMRPAFMDEYERFERELEQQYVVYLEKFRNLDYLEYELDQYNKREMEKLQESERVRKKIQMSIYEDNERTLRGGDEALENERGAGDEINVKEEETPQGRNGGRPNDRDPTKDDNRRNPSTNRKPVSPDDSEISEDDDEDDDDSDDSNPSGSQALSRSGSGSGSDLSDDEELIDEDDGSGSFSEEGSLPDGAGDESASHSGGEDF